MAITVLFARRRNLRLLSTLAVIAVCASAKLCAQTKPHLGDACQLTQSVQTCQSMGKLKMTGTGLFVSIAMAGDSDLVGAAHGQASSNSAEQVALADCKAIGGKNCKVLRTEKDTCLALAIANVDVPEFNLTMTDTGAGVNADRAAAGAQAVAECAKAGGKQCILRTTQCATDNPAFPSRLPIPSGGTPGAVDAQWVGTWEFDLPAPYTGRWLWQISANGTYELHSEAFDGTLSNVGTVTAKAGHYTLHATNISWDDAGTYSSQGSGAMTATGRLGTGTWHRISGEDE